MIKNNISELEKAEILQKEAKQLLYDYGVYDILSQNNKVNFTGSFAYNLMAWNDIDLSLEFPSKESKEEILNKIASIAYNITLLDKHPKLKVHTIKVQSELNKNPKYKHTPSGITLGIKLWIKGQEYTHPWKLDIWYYSDPEQYIKNKEYNCNIINKLNPQAREIILKTKASIINKKGRTPSNSGYYIYDAVLNKNILSVTEIKQYLVKNGVITS